MTLANKKVRRVPVGAPPPDFAKFDPAIAIASIFRPVTKGPRPKIDVTREFDGYKLRFVNYEALDVRDQSVLLGVCGLSGVAAAGPEGIAYLDRNASGVIGKQLWLDLQPSERAVSESATVVTCSYYQLMHAAGIAFARKPSLADYDRLKDILFRLSSVGCRAEKDGYDWSMRMLAYAAKPDGTISIALNSRFAAALGAGGHYIHVNLEERRQLSTDIAELLHCYLTSWIRKGSSQRVLLDKLVVQVWGAMSKNDATNRKWRERIKHALEEVDALDDWSVNMTGRGEHALAKIARRGGKKAFAKDRINVT